MSRAFFSPLLTLPLLLGVGTINVAQAQRSADAHSGDHAGPPHGHQPGHGLLDGPPAPSFMQDSIRLSGKELQQYTQTYQSHMTATKATRDSVRNSMQEVRAAFEKGDRSEARTRRDQVKQQWKQLADQDKKFEDGLKHVLTNDQLTRYQEWKDRRRHEAREQWRQHRADARRKGWTTRHDSSSAPRQQSDSGQRQTR
jgi:Spy/CpxP family protein refolding chaperone